MGSTEPDPTDSLSEAADAQEVGFECGVPSFKSCMPCMPYASDSGWSRRIRQPGEMF